MRSRLRPAHRRSVVGAIALTLAVTGVPALAGTAAAHDGAPDTAASRPAGYRIDSAPLATGLYQSAYSARNHVLWATVTDFAPEVAESSLLKVDPRTLKVKAAYTPPVTDPATGAVEAVFGVAVDDEHDTVWTTDTVDDAVSVYSQRTGKRLASLPGVAHAREVAVDPRHNLAWASGFGDGSIVAFDTRTFEEKQRIQIDGAQPAGVAVDARTGDAYVTDLGGDRIIQVSVHSDTPRFVPTGDGPISVALSTDGRTAYTADQEAGAVSVVDLRQGAVKTSVPTGAGALSVDVDRYSGHVFVANRDAGTTTVVDPRKGLALTDLDTGANSNHVEIADGAAYVVDKSAAGPDGSDSVHRVTSRR